MHKKVWRITQAQIAARDIDGAILQLDPEQILESRIREWHGGIRPRIEGFNGLVEVITDPLTRKFFRKLHDQWPWAGFFLHVQPITLNSSAEDIIDLSVFMAIALCQLAEIRSIVTPRGIGLHFDTHPLRLHLCDVRERAAQLAGAVDIPAAAIEERDNQICESVASFFRARQKPHP